MVANCRFSLRMICCAALYSSGSTTIIGRRTGEGTGNRTRLRVRVWEEEGETGVDLGSVQCRFGLGSKLLVAFAPFCPDSGDPRGTHHRPAHQHRPGCRDIVVSRAGQVIASMLRHNTCHLHGCLCNSESRAMRCQ
jgi:hypothetical protein